MLKPRGLAAIGLAAGLAGAAAAETLSITDTKPGTFIDISDTGQNLGISGEMSATINSTVSNAVLPGGDVVVGNNGGLAFGDPPSTYLDPNNAPVFDELAFGGGQAVLGFWDDIGNIYGTVLSELRRGTLIVQWQNKGFDDDPNGGTITFQIQVFDTADIDPNDPVYAQIIYADVEQFRPDGGGSATIGYQDGGAGFNHVQWSFNTSGAVSNGTVLSLVPEPGALTLLLCAIVARYRRR